jgi:hypothetical protein
MSHCVVHDTTEQHQPQMAAVHVPTTVRKSSDSELEAALVCAALDLITSVNGAPSLDAAAISVVNRLKSFFAADGVALGLMHRGRCRVAAVAGAVDVNRDSDLSRALAASLSDAVADRHADGLSDSQRFADVFQTATVQRCRLATPDAAVAGALLVWGSASEFETIQVERFLQVLSEPLATALLLQQRAAVGTWRRTLCRVAGRRRWLLWIALPIIASMVLFLLPYRIACDCSAEPQTQRFVSAPFAGVFEKSLVRPGDVVTKGALLGQMDGRELRIELATITANYEQARKSHDVNLAAGKVAAAQIDRLELARLEQQRSLVEHRMANLAIRSPVAGYVIGGDLKRTEGAPLTVGQVLFEIAPLDQMIVEVAIPDDDIGHVQAGQLVSIRFDARAGEDFVGRLARIHPRSETRDSQNVFIGEVSLDETASALRPGMKGRARILVEGKSLAKGFWERTWHVTATFFGL